MLCILNMSVNMVLVYLFLPLTQRADTWPIVCIGVQQDGVTNEE